MNIRIDEYYDAKAINNKNEGINFKLKIPVYVDAMEYMQKQIDRKVEHIQWLLDQYMGESVLPSVLDKQMNELYGMIIGQGLLRGEAEGYDVEVFKYDEMNLQYIAEFIIPRLIEADQKGGR